MTSIKTFKLQIYFNMIMFQPDLNRELQKRMINSVDIMTPLLRAFSNSYRYRVLINLLDSPKSFSHLMEQYNLGRTALANHLNILVEADLVEKVKKGTYTLSQKGLNLLQIFASVYDNLKLQDIRLRHSLYNQYIHGNYAGQASHKKIISQEAIFQPTWLSYIGCFTGVLQSYGLTVNESLVGGYSGYCFFINVVQGRLCPSGPTAFTSELLAMFNHGLEGLGCKISTISMGVPLPQSVKVTPSDREIASQFFQKIKNEIDSHNRPVILWGASIPEYGIVNGYEGNAYICSNYRWMVGIQETPIRYDSLVAPGVLHAFTVEKPPSMLSISEPTDQKQQSTFDKKALLQGIKILSGEYAEQGYVSGISSYSEWAKVLEVEPIGPASYHGQSYVIECLYEAKTLTVKFLEFLANRYYDSPPGPWLRKAVEESEEIKDIARKLQKIFPFAMSGEITTNMISKGASLLRTIPPYERIFVEYLQNAVDCWI